MGLGKSLADLRAEARKCVLLCANCHGEVEAGLTPSPPAQSKYCPGDTEHTSAQVVPLSHGNHLNQTDCTRRLSA